MTLPAPFTKALVWTLPALVLLSIVVTHRQAVERVERITALQADNLVLVPSAETQSGYAGDRRRLVVPGHTAESFEWIIQAEKILHDGTWRLRTVTYDNAPNGRPVESTSAHRWWLAALAKILQGERSTGAAVERAALWSPGVQHGLVVMSAVGLIAWQWGAGSAALAALLLGLTLPVSGAFYPGVPAERGLAMLFTVWAVVPFLAALRTHPKSAATLLALAGVGGALLLWASLHRGVPLVASLVLVGLLAQRRRAPGRSQAFAWGIWAGVGAMTVVVVYALEYLPDAIDWKAQRLHQAHPLYAVAWTGLALMASKVCNEGPWTKARLGFSALGAALAAAPVIVMQVTGQDAFLSAGTSAEILAFSPGLPAAVSLPLWLKEEGGGLAFWSLALPFALAGSALWRLLRSETHAADRPLVWGGPGPIGLSASLGLAQLTWWSTASLLMTLVGGMTFRMIATRRARLVFAGMVALAALPGAAWIAREEAAVTTAEAQSLAERDLAHWLSTRTDEYHSVVLAPPALAPALYFYGGLGGLGSPYRENEAGFVAAVRIASATSPDEAFALATQRQLSHIVMPSWDSFLDDYAELGAVQVEHTMVAMLHNWLPPRWLRPVHHPLPKTDEDRPALSAKIFEVVETQDNATALSRLGEYFIETGQMRFADAIAVTLRQSFPSDLNGLIAQAQIAVGSSNRPLFMQVLQTILPYLEEGRDGDLLWDRRVNLANLLMLGQQEELAREQVEYCMDEVDEFLLRTVPAPSLFRFMILCRSIDEPFPSPDLEQAAKMQLPRELRERL